MYAAIFNGFFYNKYMINNLVSSEEIFKKIDFLCRINKISEKALNDEINFSADYLGATRRRGGKPSAEAIRAVCDFFNISETEFYDIQVTQNPDKDRLHVRIDEKLSNEQAGKLADIIEKIDDAQLNTFIEFFDSYGKK